MRAIIHKSFVVLYISPVSHYCYHSLILLHNCEDAFHFHSLIVATFSQFSFMHFQFSVTLKCVVVRSL